MDIVLGDGSIFVGDGFIKGFGLPCLMLLQGEPGPIGRKDEEKYPAGKEIFEEDAIVRIIFTKKESMEVFKKHVASLTW